MRRVLRYPESGVNSFFFSSFFLRGSIRRGSLPVLGLEQDLGGDLALDDAAEKAGGVGGHGWL